jgi:DNA-binding response OmpR family regulator
LAKNSLEVQRRPALKSRLGVRPENGERKMPLILIAEDDHGTSRLAATALRNQGHEVITAPDGLSAWRLIEMRSPSLVVSEVNMPGMSGHELLNRLRAHPRLALTPVILLTSLQERKDMRQGMALGANDYLTKPLRPKELIEAVDAQLDQRRRREAMQISEVQGVR